MKEFDQTAAQGDVIFERVDALPSRLGKKVGAKRGKVIVTHSETGHHHVMDAEAVQLFADASNPLIQWLEVARPTSLDHQREQHTHESIMFKPGVFKVTRQQEFDPLKQSARVAID